MQKLITWAKKCGLSRPNVWAIVLPVLARSSPRLANRTRWFIRFQERRGGKRPRADELLSAEEQRVEHDGFRQRHAEHGQRDHLAERAGIAPDRLGGFHADKSHADGRTQTGQADLDAAAHFSQNRSYHIRFLSLC